MTHAPISRCLASLIAASSRSVAFSSIERIVLAARQSLMDPAYSLTTCSRKKNGTFSTSGIVHGCRSISFSSVSSM